jgi:hypothetical protein
VRDVEHAAVVARAERGEECIAQRQRGHEDLTEPGARTKRVFKTVSVLAEKLKSDNIVISKYFTKCFQNN